MMNDSRFGPHEIKTVPIAEINPDLGIQLRVGGIDARKVEEYTEHYREGRVMPAIALFWDGKFYYRADGEHRVLAVRAAHLTEIQAKVYQGGRREASLYATGSNADFGLPRSRETVNEAILALLRDPEWYQWSDHVIAEHVNCSPTTVKKRREDVDAERAGQTAAAPVQTDLFGAAAAVSEELRIERDADAEPGDVAQAPAPRPRKGKDGRVINTGNIGKASATRAEERARKVLAAAEDVGRTDAGAGKSQRNQGGLLLALRDHVEGKLPPGMLKTVYAAYVGALQGEQSRLAAQPKEEGYQPILKGATGEAMRGLPPRRSSAASAPVTEPAPTEGVLDLTPLHEVVDQLASDPARKLEVGQELLRLAGEFGAVQAGEVALADIAQMRDKLAASMTECKQLRTDLATAQAELKRLRKEGGAGAKAKKASAEPKGKEAPEKPRPVGEVLGAKAAKGAASWQEWGGLQAPTAKTPSGRRGDAEWLIVTALGEIDLNADDLRPSEVAAALKGLGAVLRGGGQAEPVKARGGKRGAKVAHG